MWVMVSLRLTFIVPLHIMTTCQARHVVFLGPSRFSMRLWKNRIVIQRLLGSMPVEPGSNSIISMFSRRSPSFFYLLIFILQSVPKDPLAWLADHLPMISLRFTRHGTTEGTYQYNPDGRLFALALPSGCVEFHRLWICVPYVRTSSVRVH
jgi:hypothetical protein